MHRKASEGDFIAIRVDRHHCLLNEKVVAHCNAKGASVGIAVLTTSKHCLHAPAYNEHDRAQLKAFHHRESESTRSPMTFRMQHDQVSVRVLTAIDRSFHVVETPTTGFRDHLPTDRTRPSPVKP